MLGHVKVGMVGDMFPKDLEKERLDDLGRMLARCKVRDLGDPNVEFEPMYGEIAFEKKRLSKPKSKGVGVLYDGHRLMTGLQPLIPEGERTMDKVHMVFTNRLFGTFDPNDARYHARVVICGFPSIVSTTGLVEAPAKPKEFYAVKQRVAAVDGKIPIDVIKEQFKGRFIEMDDERMTEVLKGYALQVIFYHLTYEPFCNDRSCRLYNAHWQEEVLEAQLSGRDLCDRHEAVLERFRQGDRNREVGKDLC